MTRRPGPWGHSRPRIDWLFAGLLAFVVVGAFTATLVVSSPSGRQSFAASADRPVDMVARGEDGATGPGPDAFDCRVVHVNDGDTLRCADGTRVRLHAVAARESDGTCFPGHPCPSGSAEAATAMLRGLAGGRTIQCRPTGSSYDRITAICWTSSGQEINCALVESGVALKWDRFDRQARICRT